MLTVRDYDKEPRGKGLVKPVRAVTRDGVPHVVTQVWDFDDDGTHYDLAMHVTEERASGEVIAPRVMHSRYYAIGIDRLLALLQEAGFADTARIDGAFYQPVLVGTKPAS